MIIIIKLLRNRAEHVLSCHQAIMFCLLLLRNARYAAVRNCLIRQTVRSVILI